MATTPVLVSIGGVSVNGGGYSSCVDPGMLRSRVVQRDIMLGSVSGGMPQYAGYKLKERQIFIQHRITNDGSHETNLLALKKLYDPDGGTKTLIWTDGDGVNKTCTVVYADFYLHDAAAGINADHTAFVGVWVLLSGKFPWSSTSSVAAAAKTATPATVSVANAGNITSPAVIYTLKPTAAKTAANGQRYGRYINLLWKSERATPAGGWPVLLTTFDHAAEVTATRSMGSGDDVELYVNQTRQPCWASTATAKTWNTATCDVWANVVHPPARYWTYTSSATLGSGATSMTVRATEMATMPAVPFYAIWETSGNEVVQVTAFDAATSTLTISRGLRGTTAATHPANDKLYWMPWAGELAFGWTSAPARTNYVDDNYKPIFLTGTSASADNTAWTYRAYYEADTANDLTVMKPRPGSWRVRVNGDHQREKKKGRGDQYWRYSPGPTSNPSTTLSVDYKGTVGAMGLPLSDGFDFTTPVGVSSFVTSYTVGVGYGTALKARGRVWMYDRSGIGEIMGTWDNDIAASGSPTYTPTVNAYQISLLIDPFDPLLDNAVNIIALEPTTNTGFDLAVASVVNFASSDRPVLKVETSNRDIYQFGRPDAPATLANTSGDTLKLYGPIVTLSDTLTIDVDAGTITNTTRNEAVRQRATGTMPGLPTGTNNVTYTETGLTGGASIDIGVSQFQSASN